MAKTETKEFNFYRFKKDFNKAFPHSKSDFKKTEKEDKEHAIVSRKLNSFQNWRFNLISQVIRKIRKGHSEQMLMSYIILKVEYLIKTADFLYSAGYIEKIELEQQIKGICVDINSQKAIKQQLKRFIENCKTDKFRKKELKGMTRREADFLVNINNGI